MTISFFDKSGGQNQIDYWGFRRNCQWMNIFSSATAVQHGLIGGTGGVVFGPKKIAVELVMKRGQAIDLIKESIVCPLSEFGPAKMWDGSNLLDKPYHGICLMAIRR